MTKPTSKKVPQIRHTTKFNIQKIYIVLLQQNSDSQTELFNINSVLLSHINCKNVCKQFCLNRTVHMHLTNLKDSWPGVSMISNPGNRKFTFENYT